MDSVAGMRVFARVVETGSFSEAGRQLGMAPSSVSRRVDDLEYELGAHLFYRSTRKLSLTEAGRLYFERASQILIDVDEAKLAISQLDGSPSGILRVTVPTGIGRYLVASGLPVFLQRYPAVNVVVSMTDQVLDIVEAGIDLAIRVGPQRDSNLIARKIGSSRRFVTGSPSYLKNAGTPQKPIDLEGHNCLIFRAHPGKNMWKFDGPDGSVQVGVSGSFFATDAGALAVAAVAGMGLILLPDWNIGTELAEGRLQSVLTKYRAIPEASPIYAVYPQQRYLPPKVRAFVDFLSEHFSNSPSDIGSGAIAEPAQQGGRHSKRASAKSSGKQ